MFDERKGISSLADQEAYWRKKLSEGSSLLQLFTDFPRPAVAKYLRGCESITLSRDLHRQLRDFCISSNQNIFVTLLAALNILLFRYTNQETTIIGTASHNSMRISKSGPESFNNPVALFFDLKGNPDFLELLSRVTRTVQEAGTNRDYPFEEVIGLAGPANVMGLAPVFQIMMLSGDKDFDDMQHYIVRCDLALVVRTGEERLSIDCQYDSDLFEPETIQRILAHLQNLLAAALRHPQENIAQLPMLSIAEQNQILVEWNDTAADYPRDSSVPAVFEAQAAATPAAVALTLGNEALTYSELNMRANRLAHYLLAQGVQPETIVGLYMERSIEMIISLLAILKAGGAYLPLDPEHPEERLTFLIQDSQVSFILTQARLADRLRTYGIQTLCGDQEDAILRNQSDSNPSTHVNARNLCYIIYTSGSTGKPKGACVEHRGVLRTVKARNFATLSPGEVFLQISSLSFDASVSEIWGTLLNGGRLVLFPERKPTISEIDSAIQKSGITSIHLIGSLFNQFIEMASTDLGCLTQVLTGGDVLSVRHAAMALQKLGNGRLINCYGPTECSDASTCYHVSSVEGLGSIPIGRPISNTKIYILDPWLQPVPIGVPGEIYIGGDGVSRGYWNRPELTAHRFLRDLFDSDSQARMYKTGDRGRWLNDGNIEFLGRFDNQVKIRGFRIELEEVQCVLSQNEAVRECVVLALNRSDGEKRLVAYVIPDRSAAPTSTQLRSYLRAKLPEYMIPSFFVFLDSFPSTPTDKVDRKALASMDIHPIAKSNVTEEPRSEADQVVLRIWSEVLGRNEIGIRDNFFDLGGDSLLAMQIIHRLQSHFQVELPVRSFFDTPTIAGLSDLIAGKK